MNTIKSIKDLPERIQGDGLRADEYTAYSHHVTLAILNDDDFNKVQNHNVRMVLYSDKYNAIAIHNDRDFIIIRESAFFTTPPKSTVSAEEIIDKYFKYNDFDKKRVIEAMEEYRNQTATFTPNPKSIKDFIDKWNVGFEDSEQKAEFAADMEAELMAIFTTP